MKNSIKLLIIATATVIGLIVITIVKLASVPSLPIAVPTILLVIPSGATPALGLTVSDSIGTSMVYVPSGCFIMGSDDLNSNAQSGGAPFKMCLPHSYWIDKTDVTNATYQKFIDAGGYKAQGAWWSDSGWSWLHSMDARRPYNYDGFTDPQQPRVGIMWYEADAYCRWRSARLPTEPEWEYAARGPNSLTYPWGNTFDPAKVVYAANSNNYPAPVGSKPSGASWVGALDMSGNVMQWTHTADNENDPVKEVSKFYRYPYPATNDGRESGIVDYQAMVVRGSAWADSYVDDLKATFRSRGDPDQEYNRQIGISFRCVRSF